MAKPRFEPTDEQRHLVKTLSGIGVPQKDICQVIINPGTDRPIDHKTLRAAFRQELDMAALMMTAKVANNLYQHATGNGPKAVSAAIFWLKTRAGWREPAKGEPAPGDTDWLDDPNPDR